MSAMPDRPSRPGAELVPDCQISVVPVSGGWSVETELVDAPLMFRSGAKAEERARALARRVAVAGRDAKVLVHDRSRALVGTWRYFARDGEGPMAELPILAGTAAGAAI
jgi:hypothetical protein